MVYDPVLQSPTKYSIDRFENEKPRRMRLMARASWKVLPSLGTGGGRFHRFGASISLSRPLHRIAPFADVGERAKPGREGVSVALSPLHQPKQNIKRTGGENHAPKVFWGSFMAERGLLGYLAAILLRGRCAILLSTFSHGVPNWATPPKGCPV